MRIARRIGIVRIRVVNVLEILDIDAVVINFASRWIPLDVDAKTPFATAANVAWRMRAVLLTVATPFLILLHRRARIRSRSSLQFDFSDLPSTTAARTARAPAIVDTVGRCRNDGDDDDHNHHHHNNRQNFRHDSVFETTFKSSPLFIPQSFKKFPLIATRFVTQVQQNDSKSIVETVIDWQILLQFRVIVQNFFLTQPSNELFERNSYRSHPS